MPQEANRLPACSRIWPSREHRHREAGASQRVVAIADWRTELRRIWTGLVVVLLLAACGGASELSLTEYVNRLNVIVDQARQDYEVLVSSPHGGVLVADGDQLDDFTPQDLQVAFERVREIESKVDEATSAIDPPDQVAVLHHLFFDFDSEFIAAQEALATRAGTAADWEELSESAEMAAYRVALTDDKQTCLDAQSEVNAIGDQRGVFADTPWIPGELKELFEVGLGCDGYPADPSGIYRYPPESAP